MYCDHGKILAISNYPHLAVIDQLLFHNFRMPGVNQKFYHFLFLT